MKKNSMKKKGMKKGMKKGKLRIEVPEYSREYSGEYVPEYVPEDRVRFPGTDSAAANKLTDVIRQLIDTNLCVSFSTTPQSGIVKGVEDSGGLIALELYGAEVPLFYLKGQIHALESWIASPHIIVSVIEHSGRRDNMFVSGPPLDMERFDDFLTATFSPQESESERESESGGESGGEVQEETITSEQALQIAVELISDALTSTAKDTGSIDTPFGMIAVWTLPVLMDVIRRDAFMEGYREGVDECGTDVDELYARYVAYRESLKGKQK